MSIYQTLDYLPDLTVSEMTAAGTLNWAPVSFSSIWDNEAAAYGSESNAILHDNYRFTAQEGATYDIFSLSYFDPYILLIYDSFGNVIAANTESDDGSPISLGGTSYRQDVIWGFVAPYTGTYYVSASWNQGSYYTFYDVAVYEDIDTIPRNTINGTASADRISDTSASCTINLFDGNDFVSLGAGNDTIDGGAGIDTASYSLAKSSYTITTSATGIVVSARTGSDGTDTLTNVERVKFADATIAFDTDGNAGQVYRLYQAAFARTPDTGGLGTWINYMEHGHSLNEVSTLFQQSAEFTMRYGTNVSTTDFVTLLYQNVLHRTPDAGGFDHWTSLLNSNQLSRSDVLIGFSESTENKAALIGVIQNGMEFIPVV